MLDFRPHLDFFKVVELEISCLGSRSKNPELEYVSSYDTFHFWKVCTLRGVHEISAKSEFLLSRQINSRDFRARPSGQIEDTILIFNSPEYQNLWWDLRSNPSGQSFFNFSKCVLSGGKTLVFPWFYHSLEHMSGFNICMLEYVFVLDHLDVCWSVVCDVV